MDKYFAVIRLKRSAAPRLVCARPEGVMAALRGVDRVEVDASTDSICVTFDRTTITLGDLVRSLEDGGWGVSGVSQGRDTAAAAATA
jgi:hypothetical protein